MKLSKRQHMIVQQSGKVKPERPSFGSDEPVHTLHQHFRFGRKHQKGSTRPVGYFHTGGNYEETVHVKWLWTEKLEFFAPEVTFRPRGVKVAIKVAKALDAFGYRQGNPDSLSEALKATVVEYMNDNAPGCWDDWRPLRVPGENAMMTIARAAL